MGALDRPQKDIFSKEFLLGVRMGLYPGYEIIDKFGENPDIQTTTDPEDAWEGGGLYPFDPDGTAPIVSIASTNPADTNIPIELKGSDAAGNRVIQTITTNGTNGTTRVPLATPLWRFNIGEVQNDSNTVRGGGLQGNLMVYTGTGPVPALGDPEVRGVLLAGNNRTQMAVYTIPLGKVGFLLRGELGLQSLATGPFASNANAVCKYFSRRYGKNMSCKKTLTVTSSGSSNYADKRNGPDPIPALTDIWLNIQTVTEELGVWGAFDILLVDNDKLPASFLTAIGQPGV